MIRNIIEKLQPGQNSVDISMKDYKTLLKDFHFCIPGPPSPPTTISGLFTRFEQVDYDCSDPEYQRRYLEYNKRLKMVEECKWDTIYGPCGAVKLNIITD